MSFSTFTSRLLLFSAFLFSGVVAMAQPSYMISRYSGGKVISENNFIVTVGASFFNGDINFDPVVGRSIYRLFKPERYSQIKDNTGSNPGLLIGIGYRFKARPSHRISYQADVHYFSFNVDDLWPNRNLGFKSNNLSFTGALSFDFVRSSGKYNYRRTSSFVPYGSIGLGFGYYNPYIDFNGVRKSLANINTEGVDYSRVVPIMPIAVGLRIKTPSVGMFLFQLTYTHTASDHIDDASAYSNKDFPNDPVRDQLADRSSTRNYKGQRANPSAYDGYFNATLSWGLPSFSTGRRR